MSVARISGMNAVILIALSAWAYVGADTPSLTALIPGAVGCLLLALTPLLHASHRPAISKVTTLASIGLTALILIALIMPLRGAIAREDLWAMIRVGIMMLSSTIALWLLLRHGLTGRTSQPTPKGHP